MQLWLWQGLFVFATTKQRNPSMCIFDANKTSEFGEWSVIEYDQEQGILDEYKSFLSFLKDTADTLRSL